MALARGAFSASTLQQVARGRRKSAEFFVKMALRSRCARRQADFGERAAPHAPNNALIQAQFAVYAAAVGRRDEALAAMTAADTLEPGRPLRRLQRSRVLELLDDMAAAIAVMKSLCAAAPEAREYRRRLASGRAVPRGEVPQEVTAERAAGPDPWPGLPDGGEPLQAD